MTNTNTFIYDPKDKLPEGLSAFADKRIAPIKRLTESDYARLKKIREIRQQKKQETERSKLAEPTD